MHGLLYFELREDRLRETFGFVYCAQTQDPNMNIHSFQYTKKGLTLTNQFAIIKSLLKMIINIKKHVYYCAI